MRYLYLLKGGKPYQDDTKAKQYYRPQQVKSCKASQGHYNRRASQVDQT